MNIKIEKVEKLVAKFDQIFLSADGEKVLIDLLALQEKIETAIKTAKLKLETAALMYDKNFTSIQGSKVKVSYRAYGSRYAIDESLASQLPDGIVSKKEVLSINTDEVDRFIKANGALPLGINEPIRHKTISISVKK